MEEPRVPKPTWIVKTRRRWRSGFRSTKTFVKNLSIWVKSIVAVAGGVAVLAAAAKGIEYFVDSFSTPESSISYPSNPLKSGGFERIKGQPQISTVIGPLGSVPKESGIWGGDKGEVVQTFSILNGKSELIGVVKPFGGSSQMLRFLNTNAVPLVGADHPKAKIGEPDAASDNDSCQIQQIIDLKPYSGDLDSASVQARAVAYFRWFNSKDFENEDPLFRIDLTAHPGEITDHHERLKKGWYFENGWNGEVRDTAEFFVRARLDFRETVQTSIENGWVKLETPLLILPKSAKYLTVELVAQELPITNQVDGIEFPAHFVDNVSVQLSRVR